MKNKGLWISYFILGMCLITLFGYGVGSANQTSTKTSTAVKKVGVLQYVSHPALDSIYKGVIQGLKDNGYEEGKNLEVLFQNGQADQSKLATMSQQLVNKQADVLVGIATPAAQALANATQDIPIVLGPVGIQLGNQLGNQSSKEDIDLYLLTVATS